jgi:uncharacterized membrane protein YvlD (DUF360 family)
MPIVLLMVAAITPVVIALALHRTRLWWLGGAVLYVVAAAFWLFVRPHDDDLFAGFDHFFYDVATFGMAIYGTVVLGISTLIHQVVISQRRLAGTRSNVPASRRTPAPRRSSDT